MRGVRIQAIVRELHGEKIDVIEWNPAPTNFIAKARQVGKPHFLQFVLGRSLKISTPVNAIDNLQNVSDS